MSRTAARAALLIVFTFSGFAGLIYESIWSHYLKLFLGHAAYAQTLVLLIFMGGLALGAALAGRWSCELRHPLRLYALAEAAIGAGALVFHPLFDSWMEWVYGTLIPALEWAPAAEGARWLGAALPILPQALLLGVTFPLMSAGFIRRFPERQGASLALLYFANSLGGAAGVLASGFVFIARLGLPGTLLVAGGVNLAVAAAAWALAGPARAAPSARPAGERAARVLLLVAFLTGAASFMYEIGWIRLLSLVLGASTHAFEIMLSAFILGLAVGGLWIRRRIDALASPALFLVGVQLAMGFLALATLPLYGRSFLWMSWLIEVLPRSDAGYGWFNLASHGIALAVMLPATFCAGMTLPLITLMLLRRGLGERAIGSVYAWNTVGSVAGVVTAVHAAMPALGVRGLLALGAAADIAAALLLWRWLRPPGRLPLAGAAAGSLAVALALSIPGDSYRAASGVYRTGMLLDQESAAVLYHRDGKTATVSVVRTPDGAVSLRTNGKPDAGLMIDPRVAANQDEATVVMLGALPLFLRPQARTFANIGMGSGVTTHTILLSPVPERVDTIEIEPLMVEAARLLRPRNERAFNDPRGRIHIEDARTFFARRPRRYDVIISEPSNPWVSGVAGLFTSEFYRRVRDHLAADGLLVQWVHLYESDLDLVLSIFKALAESFPHFDVYTVNSGDLIVAASPLDEIGPLRPAPFEWEPLRRLLERVGVHGLADLELRRVCNRQALSPLLAAEHPPANSDFRPYVDRHAARARFRKLSARQLLDLDLMRIPVWEMLGGGGSRGGPTAFSPFVERTVAARMAAALLDYYLGGPWKWEHPEVRLLPEIRRSAEVVRAALEDCSAPLWLEGMHESLARRVIPFAAARDLEPVWNRLQGESCRSALDAFQNAFISLLRSVSRRDGPAMVRAARLLLEDHPGRLSASAFDFTLAAAVLGSLASRDRAAAREVWRRHAPRLEKGRREAFRWRVLLAHAGIESL